MAEGRFWQDAAAPLVLDLVDSVIEALAGTRRDMYDLPTNYIHDHWAILQNSSDYSNVKSGNTEFFNLKLF